jgi:hypothetical protein
VQDLGGRQDDVAEMTSKRVKELVEGPVPILDTDDPLIAISLSISIGLCQVPLLKRMFTQTEKLPARTVE